MDVRKFAVEETGVVSLLASDDTPMVGEDKLPMTVTVYGPGSKQHGKATAVNSNRLIEKLRKKGKIEETDDQKRRENAEFLAACTKEFSPNIEYDGLKGEALFKAVYADREIGFIAEQVSKFIAEWGNFTKGLPKP